MVETKTSLSQHQSQSNENSLVQFDYEKAVSNYLGTQSTLKQHYQHHHTFYQRQYLDGTGSHSRSTYPTGLKPEAESVAGRTMYTVLKQHHQQHHQLKGALQLLINRYG